MAGDTNQVPEQCKYDTLTNKGSDENNWKHQIFTPCYTAIVGEGKKIKNLEEENKKLKAESYSSTEVGGASIGAGGAGLAVGIPTGLFLIPKILSWFK